GELHFNIPEHQDERIGFGMAKVKGGLPVYFGAQAGSDPGSAPFIRISSLDWRGVRFEDIRITGQLSGRELNISRLAGRVQGASVEARLRLWAEPQGMAHQGHVEWKPMQSELAQRVSPLSFVGVAGRVSGEADWTGQGAQFSDLEVRVESAEESGGHWVFRQRAAKQTGE
ncbi:MAG: hypothetical protein JW937_10040, partial [Candidatus Omnitrophica bacterium]|nr:hypothetical protein [Candidatus Omnitrophota bacterium]